MNDSVIEFYGSPAFADDIFWRMNRVSVNEVVRDSGRRRFAIELQSEEFPFSVHGNKVFDCSRFSFHVSSSNGFYENDALPLHAHLLPMNRQPVNLVVVREDTSMLERIEQRLENIIEVSLSFVWRKQLDDDLESCASMK
jgi:hypothetical protein